MEDKQVYSIRIVDGKLHVDEYMGHTDIPDTVLDLDNSVDILDSEVLVIRASKKDMEDILALDGDTLEIPVIQDGSAYSDW